MTTHNTGNPVPSAAVKDLYDNAENLDKAINDPNIDSWFDRLGFERLSWSGMEAKLKVYIANGGFVPYATAADLPTTDPGDGSRLAWVSNDDTPGNNGAWVWNPSTGQFIKSKDLSTQIAVELGVVDGRQGGLEVAFLNPNIVQDTSFSTLIGSGSAFGTTVDGVTFFRGADAVLTQSVADDGRPALNFALSGTANSFVAWGVPASVAGSIFSASLRILGGQAMGSITRVMLQQFTEAGAEITAARRTSSIAAGVVPETLVEFAGVARDPSASSVRLRLDSNNAGTVLQVTDVLIGTGRSARFRPDWKKAVNVLVGGGVDVAVSKAAAAQVEAFSNPNLVDVGTFDFTGASPIIFGALVAATTGGVRAWRQQYLAGSGANEAAVEFGPFPASAFPSGKVSASVNLVAAAAAASGWVRVLLRQFNGASEITAARQVVTLTTLTAVTTEVSATFAGIALDPSCTSVRLYLGVLGATASSRDAYWRSPLVCDGVSTNWRSPAVAAGAGSKGRAVYISTTGSDADSGTRAAPLASLDAALSRIGGDGTVYVLPGTYGTGMRATPALVTGRVRVVGVRSGLTGGNYGFPTVLLGDRVTGITKTSGRTKVYQATVAGLPSLANFQWAYQHGVPDPTTVIDPQYRFPQHRGRTHRLPDCAKLVKTTANTLNDALAEIDASGTPKAFIDSGVLYFSVVDGGDGAAADVRLDSAAGLVATATRGAAGSLEIVGLNVMYGGLDLTPFASSHLNEVRVVGSRVNAVDYNVLTAVNLEACCAGSQSQNVGDNLNGHFGAVLRAVNFYGHDARDDAQSGHEGCSTEIDGGLVEYNGGTGIAPAYGDNAVIRNVISVRNQQRGNYKAGAFYVTGTPSEATPPESGVDTNASFIGCIDYESLTSFADDYTVTAGVKPVTALCIDCKSIRPTTRGFNVRKIVDCGYIAGTSSTARNSSTVVENSSAVA